MRDLGAGRHADRAGHPAAGRQRVGRSSGGWPRSSRRPPASAPRRPARPAPAARATAPSCTSGRTAACRAAPPASALSRIIWCSVGPADSQVAPCSRACGQNRCGVNRRGAMTASARAQRRERGRDQAVHVEQRHHAERHVVRAEPVVRGDRPGGGHEVALPQRDLLRAAGRAAGVQDDGDVVRRCRARTRAAAAGRLRRRRSSSGGPPRAGRDADHRGPGGGRRGRRRPRRRWPASAAAGGRCPPGRTSYSVSVYAGFSGAAAAPSSGDGEQQLDERPGRWAARGRPGHRAGRPAAASRRASVSTRSATCA